MSSSTPFVILVTALICLQLCAAPATCVRIERSRYHDINVEISPSLSSVDCQAILYNLEATLTESSRLLYDALDGRVYFGDFNIVLPSSWDDSCIPAEQQPLQPHHHQNQPQGNNQTLPPPQMSAPAPPRQTSAANGGSSDITITSRHHVYGDNIWTQQSGGCGMQGDQIYAPFNALKAADDANVNVSTRTAAKEFVRNWAKYRYGVFDEVGFYDDPIYTPCYYDETLRASGCSNAPLQNAERICSSSEPHAQLSYAVDPTARTSLMFAPHLDNVVMFCDSGNHNRYAPTKQNLLCQRRPTLDVILAHADFAPVNLATPNDDDATTINAQLTDTRPQFNYRRRTLTRYVVVIDDTQDMLQRDSWSFLRSAMRKWLVYDLLAPTEVGMVLANGHIVDKTLDITPLTNASHRDLVASFVPYGPADTRQAAACLSCALDKALQLLQQRAATHGAASSVILLIAPGMELASGVEQLAQTVLQRSGARIATINYPAVTRRQPLDALAHATDGAAYSVHESKFNGEKSYLQTYVTLTSVLAEIAQRFQAAAGVQLPIEIHRQTLQDNADSSSHQFNGSFFLDANAAGSSAAGFYVYTYSTESPLIQRMRLVSPTGRVYATRSDRRMPVKQLSLIASLNETGRWRYDIERFHGNPQPHIVQVLATPSGDARVPHISMRAWATRHGVGADSYIVLYCELKHGAYPVLDADVSMRVQRHDQHCSSNNAAMTRECSSFYRLLDNGAGHPDVMRGDGVYTRVYRVHTPAVLSFEVVAKSRASLTYTLADRDTALNARCCGSEMSPAISHERDATSGDFKTRYTNLTVPFERYAAPLTFHIDTKEFAVHAPEDADIDEVTDVTAATSNDWSAYDSAPLSFGQIGDLRLQPLHDSGKLLLSWQSPDLGDGAVARYELKYGFQLSAMIDRFSSASVLWNHETPSPLPAGERQQLVIDPALEPHMLNQSVYFGLRVYNALTKGARPGPVSNIVGVFVPDPRLAATTTTSSTETSMDWRQPNGGGDKDDDDAMHSVNDEQAVHTANGQPLLYILLPLLIALIAVVLLALLLCLLCRQRRGATSRKRMKAHAAIAAANAAASESTTTHSTVSHCTPLQQPDAASNVTLNVTPTSQLMPALDAPDHHTVGIPIFDCNEDDMAQKKFGSISALQFGGGGGGLHGYVIDEMKQHHQQQQQQQQLHSTPNRFYSGLSIISMQAQSMRDHQLQPPTADSWSQSTMLLRDSQRVSPFADTSLQPVQYGHYTTYDGGMEPHAFDEIPPVPPLPSSQQIYSDALNDSYVQPAPPTYTTIQRGCHPSENQLNNSYAGAVAASQLAYDNSRRLRNVTMV